MKRIGVLGGVGPQATMQFEAQVHAYAQTLALGVANEAYPPLLTYFHRQPPIVLGEDRLPVMPPRLDPAFLDAARHLGSWADFLVVTSNGMHHFQADLERAAGRPVFSMVDATIAAVLERGATHAGVLMLGGPDSVNTSDVARAAAEIYVSPLQARGVACETIGPALQAELNEGIFAVMAGRAGEEHRQTLTRALAELRGRGTDCIVLGCTELPFLLGDDSAGPDLVNPINILAEAAVRHSLC